MQWTSNEWPRAMVNLRDEVRAKALEFANALARRGYRASRAVSTGITLAREWQSGALAKRRGGEPFEVRPAVRGWEVKRPGYPRVAYRFTRRADAVRRATELAWRRQTACVVYDETGDEVERHIPPDDGGLFAAGGGPKRPRQEAEAKSAERPEEAKAAAAKARAERAEAEKKAAEAKARAEAEKKAAEAKARAEAEKKAAEAKAQAEAEKKAAEAKAQAEAEKKAAEAKADAAESKADAPKSKADAAESKADAPKSKADAAESKADAAESKADAPERLELRRGDDTWEVLLGEEVLASERTKRKASKIARKLADERGCELAIFKTDGELQRVE